MSSVSKIMDSEYEITKVLWGESPLTANEIFTAQLYPKLNIPSITQTIF